MSGRVIWFIRHGQRLDQYKTDWKDYAKDRHNPDLSPLGILQAMKVARRIAREPETVHHLVVSPFLRTLRTASFLAHELKLPICVESGVGEMRAREWFPEGDCITAPPSEMREYFPDIHPDYQSKVTPVWPESESCMEAERFAPRIATTLRLLLESLPGNIIIVGHYAVSNGGVAALTGSHVDAFIDNCTLCKVVQGDDGSWTLTMKAESAHLLEPLGI